METIFPTGTGYAAMFLVSVRQNPASPADVQRTGTIVLKRTYTINPITQTVTPDSDALPVFLQDQPANLLLNSDFESPLFDKEGKPIDWLPENVAIAAFPDPHDAQFKWLQVTGTPAGRVVQTLTFDHPLGGRTFTFCLEASASATTQIQNVQLEADGNSGGTVSLCTLEPSVTSVTPTMATKQRSGVWPAELEATAMHVVLRPASTTGVTIWYDNVQVEERSYETVYNPATTLLYEHDLAAYKPEGDLIVLGYAGAAGSNNSRVVRVNGTTYLSRTLPSTLPPEKSLFGWEPRVGSPRTMQAGSYDPLPQDPLPPNFDNRFYNGYRRDAAHAPLAYFLATAQIEIERGGSVTYRFRMAEDTATANYFTYRGTGPDDEDHWQQTSVPMHLDTLVIEPERNRCYAVWRGVWPYDDRPEDSYRRLIVEASD
jgi:hypothetical protein